MASELPFTDVPRLKTISSENKIQKKAEVGELPSSFQQSGAFQNPGQTVCWAQAQPFECRSQDHLSPDFSTTPFGCAWSEELRRHSGPLQLAWILCIQLAHMLKNPWITIRKIRET